VPLEKNLGYKDKVFLLLEYICLDYIQDKASETS
jgi:hypothetical protein